MALSWSWEQRLVVLLSKLYMPPVYMIAINEVSDQERYEKEYVSPVSRKPPEHRLWETYLVGQL
jgi:hypothetical protein